MYSKTLSTYFGLCLALNFEVQGDGVRMKGEKAHVKLRCGSKTINHNKKPNTCLS